MANFILMHVAGAALVLAFCSLNASAFSSCPTVDPIPGFDIDKYLGVWYEIKRLPARFEKGKKCIQADYQKIDDSHLSVNNSAFDVPSGKNTFRLGKASVRDPTAKNKLTVEFKVGPFNLINIKGQYNVAETDYTSYAIIYTCRNYYFFKNEYAWILSRTRALTETKTSSLVEKLKKYTDVAALITTDQANC